MGLIDTVMKLTSYTESINVNIWMVNLKVQQTNLPVTSQNKSKLPTNRYSYSTSCVFFMLKTNNSV